MPTIRIDQEVYEWLQAQATPFEDSPNSVLRRLAGLGRPQVPVANDSSTISPGGRITGKKLADEWGVDANHALYHREGTFYENLRDFPGVLFDRSGYVVFESREDYVRHPKLHIGQKLNVPDGISSLPEYVLAKSSRE